MISLRGLTPDWDVLPVTMPCVDLLRQSDTKLFIGAFKLVVMPWHKSRPAIGKGFHIKIKTQAPLTVTTKCMVFICLSSQMKTACALFRRAVVSDNYASVQVYYARRAQSQSSFAHFPLGKSYSCLDALNWKILKRRWRRKGASAHRSFPH